MISSGLSLSMGRFPAQIGRHICGQPIDLRAAGSLRALGRAYQTDSGYRVKGHWNFANGIRHANWLHCQCTIMDGDEPRLTVGGANGNCHVDSIQCCEDRGHLVGSALVQIVDVCAKLLPAA
jgi:hypothetical protein